MTQLVKLDDRVKRLQDVFTRNQSAIVKMVPRTMGDPSRLLRIAYNNIAYNVELLEVSKTERGMASILGGVMEALKLGLTIGGPAQECWLVPFKEKGIPIATLIIGYQGYRNILDRAKSVIALHPRAVWTNDEFDVDFGTQRIHHKPYWMLGHTESGEFLAAYAIATLARGGVQIEVMPKAEIDAHRARSRAANSGPWVSDYVPMALKTVVRKIAKYLPKSSELLVRALDLDDKADRGVPQDFEIADFVLPADETIKQVGHSGLAKLKEAAAKLSPELQADIKTAEKVFAQADAAIKEAEEVLAESEPKAKVVAGSHVPPLVQEEEDPFGGALGSDPDENAAIDAEVAQRDAMPPPAGDLFQTPVAKVDTVQAAVEALRRRAEDVARKRQGR